MKRDHLNISKSKSGKLYVIWEWPFGVWLVIFIYVVFLTAYLPLSAQSTQRSKIRFFELTLSNDFIFETDRYFSNGIEMMYTDPGIKKSPVNRLLVSGKRMQQVYYGLTVTQHFFTPRELFSWEVDRNDRPYASYLLIGERKTSTDSRRGLLLHSELRAGILGKYSGGESIQNGIHEILPASKPSLGWHNQIQPDLAINYLMRIEKGFVRSPHFYLIPAFDVRAGVPYTDAGMSLQFRAGRMNNYFSAGGLPERKAWELYFYGALGGKYVVYNGTLQGGLFNSNPFVVTDIKHWMGQVQTGIAYSRGLLGIKFSQYFISPEFDGGLTHKWGSVSLTYRF